MEEDSDLTKKEEKLLGRIGGMIESESMTLEKASASCSKAFDESLKSPKPIFRELLVAPEYLVFIHDFKYEKEILYSLENHFSEFSLYMGNSEFPANYIYVDCEWSLEESEHLDSFTLNPSEIVFEEGEKIYKCLHGNKGRWSKRGIGIIRISSFVTNRSPCQARHKSMQS